MSQTVTAETTALCRDHDGNLKVERIALHYDAADPYAVDLTFPGHVTDGQALTWAFARRLLAAGLDEPAGIGDVRVYATDRHVYLTLATNDGAALVELGLAFVVLFLNRSYRLVRLGAESGLLDVDAAVASLLGGVA